MVRVDKVVELKRPIVAWKLMVREGKGLQLEYQPHRCTPKIGVTMRAQEQTINADDGEPYLTGFHTYASRADARRRRRRLSYLRVVKVLIWGPATYGVQKIEGHRHLYGYTARYMKILPLRKEGGA